MEIREIEINLLNPYDDNQKKHDSTQINNVAESIKQYGFVQPIVIDKDNVVVIGHCRLLAAQKLKMNTVPCVVVDDLTDEQVKALRIVDNKTNESPWDVELLAAELREIDLSSFNFDLESDLLEQEKTETYEEKMNEFKERMSSGELSEDSEEYQEFLQKFKPKKTTDDCYTPDNIYEVVADYVNKYYGIDKSKFVRPFYPGGDYQKEKYNKDSVVVDNPPFSIISEICKWYTEHKIKFFLFAPGLTVMGIRNASKLLCGITIIYENTAKVNTSFVTNLEQCEFRTCPELYKAIDEQNNINIKKMHADIPNYEYPCEVMTSAIGNYLSKYGVEFSVDKQSCAFIRALEHQKEFNKAIFGSGYLISEKAAAEKAAAEKAAVTQWILSDREKEIIKSLK